MTSKSTDQPPVEKTEDPENIEDPENDKDIKDDSKEGDISQSAGCMFLVLEAFVFFIGKYGFFMIGLKQCPAYVSWLWVE